MAGTVKMAWRNMWRNWRRTAIALVAIVLGLVLLLMMDAMIKGSDEAIFGNAVKLYGGNVLIHAPGFRNKAARLPVLPLEEAGAVVQAATAQPTVVSASPRIATGGIVSSRDGSFGVQIVGLVPEAEAARSLQSQNIREGRWLQGDDADNIVIGRGLAELLKVGLEDRVTLMGRSRNETMRQRTMNIVGIYNLGMADAEKGQVFMSLGEAQSLYDLRDQATEVSIALQAVGTEEPVLRELQAALPGYEVDTWKTLRPELSGAIQQKLAFTTFLGLVVILIASIGILNLMMMAAFERTREMGVLRALGMRGRGVMALFLTEGALIGAVGAVIGCLVAAGLLALLARVGIDISYVSGMGEFSVLMGDRLYPSIGLGAFVSRGLLVVFIAALAALYPAWQAARREPATALHHV
jgi:ABC-type lipoprotein release transport system permease subunit